MSKVSTFTSSRVLYFIVSLSCVALLHSPIALSAEEAGNPRSLQLNEEGAAAVRSKDFARAEDLFRRSLKEDPKNLTAAYNLAGMLVMNKKENDARQVLEAAVKEAPNDVGLRTRLGDVYFGTKQIDLALQSYESAFALDPKFPQLAAKLGTVYSLKDRVADAERVLRAAVENDPKDHQTVSNYAAVLLGQGKPDEAIRYAKRALQLKVTSDVYVTLGNAYELKGDQRNALISFQRAIDLGDKRKELSSKVAELKESAGKTPVSGADAAGAA